MVRAMLMVVAAAAFVWLLASGSVAQHAAAKERAPAMSSVDAGTPPVSAQSDVTNTDDSRVDVQVYTLLAIAAAAGVGLLGLLVRIAMGWVRHPPPQERQPHD